MRNVIAIMTIVVCFMSEPVFAQLAMGHKVDFSLSWPVIEYKTKYSLAVGVHDQRPYIIKGEKYPIYAGTMRSRWGVPWDINTQSNKPLSDDVVSAVASGFMNVGIKTDTAPLLFSDQQTTVVKRLRNLGAERIVLINLREWKVDIWSRAGFFIDAQAIVYDKDGHEIASSYVCHRNVGSGDGSVESVISAAQSYLNMLLNDDKIKVALEAESTFSEVTEVGRDARFIAYNNGTVLDTKTNLMWASKDNGENINWNIAQYYCGTYRGGGFTDWRLPAIHELMELYDSNKMRPSKCANDCDLGVITTLINISCGYLWTSDKEQTGFRDGAYYINFNDGTQNIYPLNYYEYLRVLPVRTAKAPRHDLLEKYDAGIKKGSFERSRAQRLRELKKLKDDDLLTDEEYEKKRREIIDSM